jgi:glutamate racemase
MISSSSAPIIGVFDSGFGGLTVLRALLALVPGASYVYLGDTARLPYGAKSQQTIARYAVSSSRFLLDQGAELLVIACNTATALALPEIQTAAAPIPVIGVIQPGADAARLASLGQLPHVLVLATTATVESHAYLQALRQLAIPVTEKACPLLVPLVEEGWTDHPVTAEVLRIYLTEALAQAPDATTLVLGCTHYPLLKPLIERVLNGLHHPLHIIDAAQATAAATAALLPPTVSTGAPNCTFYATDSVEKFQRLGTLFLGQSISKVTLVDLGG